MILQSAGGLRPEIKGWGCYYMCLLYIINKLTDMELTVPRINKIYQLFVAKDWMSEKCFIKAPEAILGWAGVRAHIVILGDHKLPPDYPAAERDYEVAYFKIPGSKLGHFVCGPIVKQGSAYHVGYDPEGESRAVKHGVYMDKRVFRVTEIMSNKGGADAGGV